MKIFLHAFTSQDETRHRLSRSHVHHDGRHFATDGRILIVGPPDAVVPCPHDPEADITPPDIGPRLLHPREILEPLELPPHWRDIPVSELHCGTCSGTGRLRTCPDCHGEGHTECDTCGHFEDCATCCGDGHLTGPSPEGTPPARDCFECDGKGSIPNLLVIYARAGERGAFVKLSADYLRLLEDYAPGHRLHTTTRRDQRVAITFPDPRIEGVLMSCRSDAGDPFGFKAVIAQWGATPAQK